MEKIINELSGQIKKLQAEILEIEGHIQATQKICTTLEPEVKRLKTNLHEAQKIAGSKPSPENKKAVDTAQRGLNVVADKFSEAETLAKALTDKRSALEQEFESAIIALHPYEVEIMVTKAPGLVDAYNDFMRKWHETLFKIKVLRTEVDKRGGSSQLNAICPGFPSRTALIMHDNGFDLLEPGPHYGNRRLGDSRYNRDSIVAELLQPIPASSPV